MSPPFIEQFAHSLGLSTEEAERAVAGVGQLIRVRLEQEEQVSIEGLGTFRQRQEGVSFEPEESLARSVNLAYAGLPVVELPPLPEAPADPQKEAPPEDPFAHVQAERELRLPPESEDEPLSQEPLRDLSSVDDFRPAEEEPRPAQPPPVAPQAEEEPFPEEGAEPEEAFIQPEPPGPPAEAPGKEGPRDIDERPASSDEVVAEEDHGEADLDALLDGVWTPRMEPREHEHPLGPGPQELLEDADFHVMEPAGQGPSTPEARTTSETKQSDEAAHPPTPPPPGPPKPEAASADVSRPPRAKPPPTRPSPAFEALREEEEGDRERALWPILLISAVVLLATAGLVYYALVLQPGEPAAPDPVAEAPTPPADPAVPPLGEPVPEDAAPDDEPPPAETPPAEAPADSPLMSEEGVDPARGGFTWAVSEPSAAQAQRRAERYHELGYRVSVLPATVRGTTFYRVALGQFASRAEAERYREQLPDDVPRDIWILAL